MTTATLPDAAPAPAKGKKKWHRDIWSAQVWAAKMPTSCKLIALAYADHAKAGTTAWLTNQRLSELTDIKERAIQNHRGWLIREGWLAEAVPARGHAAAVYWLTYPDRSLDGQLDDDLVGDQAPGSDDDRVGVHLDAPLPTSRGARDDDQKGGEGCTYWQVGVHEDAPNLSSTSKRIKTTSEESELSEAPPPAAPPSTPEPLPAQDRADSPAQPSRHRKVVPSLPGDLRGQHSGARALVVGWEPSAEQVELMQHRGLTEVEQTELLADFRKVASTARRNDWDHVIDRFITYWADGIVPVGAAVAVANTVTATSRAVA